jgi:hypothetical protein
MAVARPSAAKPKLNGKLCLPNFGRRPRQMAFVGIWSVLADFV